jgi:hypothetical protein
MLVLWRLTLPERCVQYVASPHEAILACSCLLYDDGPFAHSCFLFLLCFTQVTYKNLDRWYKELEEYCPGIPTIVVANKIDGETLDLCLAFTILHLVPSDHPQSLLNILSRDVL